MPKQEKDFMKKPGTSFELEEDRETDANPEVTNFEKGPDLFKEYQEERRLAKEEEERKMGELREQAKELEEIMNEPEEDVVVPGSEILPREFRKSPPPAGKTAETFLQRIKNYLFK